mmetsp:Transcript_2018/g.3781  ORF Transcript_2018/g.3781 Transcript_2018/m.3781 type:complete len:837 (+) Transcript_2018:112-2622(+)
MTGKESVVKFIPFSSTVESPFWVRYCHLKLETIRLKEDPIEIRASYGTPNSASTNNNTSANRIQCQESGLILPSDDDNNDNNNNNNNNNEEKDNDTDTTTNTARDCFVVPNDRVACPGVLIGYNTKESFQKVNKNKLLKEIFCQQFFGNSNSLNAPSLVLLTFADLKQHKVLYWFGFPTLMARAPILATIDSSRTLPSASSSTTTATATATATTQQQQDEHEHEHTAASGTTRRWWMGLAEGLYRHRAREDALPAYFAVPAATKKEEDDGHTNITAPIDRNYRTNLNLAEPDHQNEAEEDVMFGFVDPTAIGVASTSASNGNNTNNGNDILMMGWPMRNLVAYLVLHLGLGGKKVSILSLRPGGCPGLRGRVVVGETNASKLSAVDGERLAQHSVLMTVTLPRSKDYDYGSNNDNAIDDQTTTAAAAASVAPPTFKIVGWELNARQKPGPRWVNLKPLLDQNHLAIQAADLNLKLMKWRMIPELNVDFLQNNCKVLLLGAGTLGCSVARTLLGWGIRRFTFVDYGTVSYSNPVRQILFDLEDCHFDHGQGKPKAEAAASALKKIAADVISEGVRLGIPMPGHASENDESLRDTVEKLDRLIGDADVVFLLTDTRESRWLPTVMAAHHDKILINAALGLDSWLVMRHGHGPGSSNVGSSNEKRLGCYFCNDVVAPENSTKNRTLDQQCTVTRPGLAPIASSMAVELLLSLLHHPLKQRAAAPAPKGNSGDFSPTVNYDSSSSSPLGLIPHQIRGSIVSYTMMTPSVPAFSCCTACSSPVLEAYSVDKFGLVSRACASMDGSYLENLSGLTAFRAEAAEKLAEMDAIDWDDDDDDDEF